VALCSRRSHLLGGLTAITVAVAVFHMPVALASISFLYGIAYGLLKIAWIVVAGVYLYDIAVHTGQFEILKSSVTGITPDRRIQLLLVAFCFGAFLEGAAGFGTPVAIAGALLIGLGFRPLQAAMLNLIANTAPVAFGAIGAPIHALASVSGLPESDLSAMIGRILPFMSVLVPFWLVRTMVSWSETLEVLPAILVVGGSFAATQFYWSNYRDSNLVDIVAGIVSLLAMVVFLRFWKPRRIWRFYDDPIEDLSQQRYTTREVLKAWLPFTILSVFVLLWGLPSIKPLLNSVTPAVHEGGWSVPYLHRAVVRAAPVVSKPTLEAAKFDFNWLSATGTGCFLAALVAGMILRVRPGTMVSLFLQTLRKMRFAVFAIAFMLGLGFVTRYSGMDAVLGLAFTRTGWFYPFFGTFLGWLGVALTGSDTSGNTLFGNLQRITAEQLHLDPVLMCAANSTGGVMGKMVDAQSICIATAATNQVGSEGRILRLVFWHSIALTTLVGLLVTGFAFILPRLVPHGLTFIR